MAQEKSKSHLGFAMLELGLVLLSATLLIMLLISWFFEINLNNPELWLGALVGYFSFLSIVATPFPWRFLAIFIWLFIIAFFISSIFQLSNLLSLIGALAIMILMIFVYLVL